MESACAFHCFSALSTLYETTEDCLRVVDVTAVRLEQPLQQIWSLASQQDMSGAMLYRTSLEMRSTEHTRSNAQQSKLAPQRPPLPLYTVYRTILLSLFVQASICSLLSSL